MVVPCGYWLNDAVADGRVGLFLGLSGFDGVLGGLVAGADAGDEPEDGEEDDEEDEEEEPDRAEEDDFFDGLGVVKDGDGFADPENAELRRAVPGDGVEALGFGEDGEGSRVLFVGVNFFIAKERENLQSIVSGGVDVTGILN